MLHFSHLRTSLSEAEDVVNEKQHILSLLVTEVLCYSQTSQGYTGSGTWGLVHLTIHQCYLIGQQQRTSNNHNQQGAVRKSQCAYLTKVKLLIIHVNEKAMFFLENLPLQLTTVGRDASC